MKKITLFFLWSVSVLAYGQDVKVEFDKTKDYTFYKTFTFGESEILTPKEKRKVSDAALHKMIREAIEKELTEKGLSRNDSAAELEITYAVGSFEHSESQNLGPLGSAPGQSRTWTNNYTQGELIVDLNDTRSKKLIWRVNSQTNTDAPEARQYIEQIVDKGFKKFAVKPKQKKQKK